MHVAHVLASSEPARQLLNRISWQESCAHGRLLRAHDGPETWAWRSLSYRQVSTGDGQRLSQTGVSVLGDNRSSIGFPRPVRTVTSACREGVVVNSDVSHFGKDSVHDVENSGVSQTEQTSDATSVSLFFVSSINDPDYLHSPLGQPLFPSLFRYEVPRQKPLIKPLASLVASWLWSTGLWI